MPTSRSLIALTTVLTLQTVVFAQHGPADAPVSVMVVGGFHMANPGHDIHNVTAPDVLLPDLQTQIVKVTDALAGFHPTKVMAESQADVASEGYARYLAGTLPPSRNEVVQLGFRLAKTAGLDHFYGIDVGGDFPYEPVQAFAKTHGQSELLARSNAEIETLAQTQTALLLSKGIAATLRYLNDPGRLSRDNNFYRQMLRVGAGPEQPGADLLTAWYRRNFLICANIVQNSRPGDRIVIFYGSGHAFLLRQCVTETPGFILVEPNSFLPK
ncbi:MAG: DUF5694 domain-containing protein [Acidobacteriota bacterium]|nr:DUF5694 domain-containing protein [Acidobacteriota bacterium]